MATASQIDPSRSEQDRNRRPGSSVIDLKASPPKVTQTVHAGKGASDISVLARRHAGARHQGPAEGTLSIFHGGATGSSPPPGGTSSTLGNPKSLPSSLKFLPDGKSALVALYGDNAIGVLRIAGASVTLDKQRIVSERQPYTDGSQATRWQDRGGRQYGRRRLCRNLHREPHRPDAGRLPHGRHGRCAELARGRQAVARRQNRRRPRRSTGRPRRRINCSITTTAGSGC